MITILVRKDFPSEALEALRQIPEIELVFDDFQRFREPGSSIFPQTVDALITDHRIPYQNGWDELFPGLKLVVSLGLPPSWDLDANVSDSGVECRYTSDAGSVSVAEMTVASMVCLSRRKAWLNPDEDAEPSALELSGKTLGIVGFGNIGKQVARLAHAFGMTILCCDPRGSEGGPKARFTTLQELVEEADYISLNLPLNRQTRGLFSHEIFASMRPGTYLIDMSQEGIVDVQAMIEAVETGKLAGVSADVYDRKRRKELDLDRFPHCIWLPLRSAATRETQARAGLEAVRIVKEYFNV